MGWVDSIFRGEGGVLGFLGSTGPRALNLKLALLLPGIFSIEIAWAHTSCPLEAFTCLIRGFEPPGAQEGMEEVTDGIVVVSAGLGLGDRSNWFFGTGAGEGVGKPLRETPLELTISGGCRCWVC